MRVFERGRMLNAARQIALVLEISLSRLFRVMGGDVKRSHVPERRFVDCFRMGRRYGSWLWLGRFLVPTPTGAELHQCMFQPLAVCCAIVGL